MGPLGFALGLEEALEAAGPAGHAELGWESWYLDDGTLVGSPDGLATVFQALKPALAGVGLTLNVCKCQPWGPGVHAEGEPPPVLPYGLAGIPVVPFGPGSGITVLGVPVDANGGRVSLRAAWDKAVSKTVKVLERL